MCQNATASALSTRRCILIYLHRLDIHFYDKIIRHAYLKKPLHFNHAKQILGLAIIYGKYGSMQINSFNNALESIKTEISENTLHDFFKSLFINGE